MVEKSDIKRLIAEELVRPEVQAALEQQRSKPSLLSRLGTFFRQPVVLTVIGFALTSIVGTFIGQEISERQLRDQQRANALAAVRSFATTASELRVAQNNFQDALAREDDAQALTRQKDVYDAAFANWSSGLYANALATREFFGFTYDNFAEQAINRSLHQWFKTYRGCLHKAYEHSETGLAEQVLDGCLSETPEFKGATSTEAANERLFQCSREIFDTLNHFIARDLNCSSTAWSGGKTPSVVSDVYDTMIRKCGVIGAREFQSYEDQFDASCTIQPPGWVRSMFR